MDWDETTEGILDTCMDTFGEEVTYSPAEGDPYTLRGVFDRSFKSVDPATGAAVSSRHSSLGVKLSDMQAEPQEGDDTVTVSGVDYTVIESQPDGQGGATLVLQKR